MNWSPLDWLLMPDVVGPALEVELAGHPSAADCPEGPDGECMVCAMRDCPFNDPLHYHHDDCPSCWVEERRAARASAGDAGAER